MLNNEDELLNKLKELESLNKNKEALSLIKENEGLILKKYYDINKIKITLLYKEKKYLDALVLIENELNVPYIPSEFNSFLLDYQKEIKNILNDKSKKVITIDDIANIDSYDEQTMLVLISKLKEFNLTNISFIFQKVFDNANISNLTKTLLIAGLSDSKVNYEYKIAKYGKVMNFNPSFIFDIRNGKNVNYISNILNSKGYDDINSSELIFRLSMLYLLDLYPFEITNKECDILLCAATILVNEMNNTNFKIDDKIDKNEIKKYQIKINSLIK